MLPEKYERVEVERELAELSDRVEVFKTFIPLNPLANSPVDPRQGYIAYSDGSVDWSGGGASEGLYRYTGSAWVLIG